MELLSLRVRAYRPMRARMNSKHAPDPALLAKAGRSVLVVERGASCGAKTFTGGRLYTYSLRELLGERAVVADAVGEPLRAEGAHHEPEFERAEPPPELEGVVRLRERHVLLRGF